jgi:hypothetical protein
MASRFADADRPRSHAQGPTPVLFDRAGRRTRSEPEAAQVELIVGYGCVSSRASIGMNAARCRAAGRRHGRSIPHSSKPRRCNNFQSCNSFQNRSAGEDDRPEHLPNGLPNTTGAPPQRFLGSGSLERRWPTHTVLASPRCAPAMPAVAATPARSCAGATRRETRFSVGAWPGNMSLAGAAVRCNAG